jgi:ribonuclease HI
VGLIGCKIEDGLRFPWLKRAPRVYVDAKILNMHDPTLQREAYVGYIVEGSGKRNVKRVSATESDDAEVEAILFAIEELKDTFRQFAVVCDHESVVSEAKRDTVKSPSVLMKNLREALRVNPSIKLEVLQANPAHGVVTEYVNGLTRA